MALSRRAFTFVVAIAAVAFSGAQESRPSGMLQEIRSHKDGIALWWVGNAGWLVKSDGLLIGMDLDLETRGKLHPPPISAQEAAAEVDVAFVTHHHGDHCNSATIRALLQGGKCMFVLPRKCLRSLAGEAIPEARVIVPEPGQPFDVKGIRVEPIHAIHGNQDFTILTREPDFLESMAHNCGYVFNIQGRRILQPGDSVLTEEHLGLKNIDVLFVSPTVHNMYVDRSMILINRLQPAHIFPQHFGTYTSTEENSFWTRGYPDELKLRLSQDLQQRYHKLRQGERFVIR